MKAVARQDRVRVVTRQGPAKADQGFEIIAMIGVGEIDPGKVGIEIAVATTDPRVQNLKESIFRGRREINMVVAQANPEPHIFVAAKIIDKGYEALVDTGSTSTLISDSVAKATGGLVKVYEGPAIKSICGSPIKIAGQITIPIEVEGSGPLEIEAVVIEGFKFDVLLGNDFNAAAGLIVDCKKSEAYTEPKSHAKIEAILVHASEAIKLPARSATIANVVLGQKSRDGVYLVTTGGKLYNKRRVSLANSLIESQEGKAQVEVTNFNNFDVQIRPGTVLGESDPSFCKEFLIDASDESRNSCWSTDDTKVVDFAEGEIRIGNSLSENEEDEIYKALAEYKDIFSFDSSNLGCCHDIEHNIDTGDSLPISRAPYRYSDPQRQEIRKQVGEMLEAGVISNSNSPWSSPVVLVKKKDGSYRMCVDLRKVNAVTKRDVYPLPNIEDALHSLRGAIYFSSLDLNNGYWQFPIKSSDREKTAFITQDGLYEFNKMPFGLTNAPALFQRAMDTILAGLKWNSCLVYLDDVVVFGPDFQTHLERLKLVFDRIREAGLTLKAKKCALGVKRMLFLGHIVDSEGIKMDPEKIVAVRDFPEPKTVTNIKSFIGLASYYRKFIKGFSKEIEPMTRLTRKNVEFSWGPEQDMAFNSVKERLMSYPILVHFNPALPIELHCDASGIGVGATLLHRVDNVEHVVSYASRLLTDCESRYSTTDKEALAVVWALEKFKHFLMGVEFTIYTDHKALCWLATKDRLPDRLQRWALQIQCFNFNIVYKTGKANGDADSLSRNPVGPPEELADSHEKYSFLINEVEAEPLNLAEAQRQDSFLSVVIEALRSMEYYGGHMQDGANDGPMLGDSNGTEDQNDPIDNIAGDEPNTQYYDAHDKETETDEVQEVQGLENYCLDNGILYKYVEGKGLRVCVPESLVEEILYAAHDDVYGGHLGIEKTMGKLEKRYFWPNMRQNVTRYIKSCIDCQTRKGARNQNSGLLCPIKVGGPFEMMGIDLLGPFPTSEMGNKYIIVASDYLTRFVEAKAVPKGSAWEVAKFLLEEVMCRYGAPSKLLSDRGSCFLSRVAKHCYQMMETRHISTTSYHPQTNGLVERFNKTLAIMMSMYVGKDQTDWDRALKFLVMAYNSSPNASTKATPFSLVYGREPRLPVDEIMGVPSLGVDLEDLDHIHKFMRESQEIARENIEISQEISAGYYNANKKEKIYSRGDKVLIYFPKRVKGKAEKLLHCFQGPYIVLEQKGPVNYEVKFEGKAKASDIVHVSRMKPYISREIVDEENFIHFTPENFDDELGDLESGIEEAIEAVIANTRTPENSSQVREEPGIRRSSRIPKAVDRLEYQQKGGGTTRKPRSASCEPPKAVGSNESFAFPQLRRSSRIPKAINRMSLFTTMALCMMTLILPTQSAFQKVNPVLWRTSKTPLVSGVTHVSGNVGFESPCFIFDNATIGYRVGGNILKDWCVTSFQSDFIRPLRSFCRPSYLGVDRDIRPFRQKRFAIMSAIAIGTIIISVFYNCWGIGQSYDNIIIPRQSYRNY